MLTEKIKRDKHRVNVEKLSPDATSLPEISGGYVLKRDWVEGNVLETEVYGDELVIRYPKEDQINEAQRSYLEGYFNDFERAHSNATIEAIESTSMWIHSSTTC